MIRTIALAYSGGLDTSIIVPWLKERYDARVICIVKVDNDRISAAYRILHCNSLDTVDHGVLERELLAVFRVRFSVANAQEAIQFLGRNCDGRVDGCVDGLVLSKFDPVIPNDAVPTLARTPARQLTSRSAS